MMPSQYVNQWIRLAPPVVLRPNDPLTWPAMKLWWDVVAGDLSWFVGIAMDNFLQNLATVNTSKLIGALPSSWFTNVCNSTAHHSGADFTYPAGSGYQGLLSSTFPSPAINACVMKRTSKVGRSGIGRVFFPAVPWTLLAKDQLTSAGAVVYQNVADSMNMQVSFMSTSGIVTLRHCLHSLQDNDLTPIDRLDVLRKTTYLYRRRVRS